MERTGGERGHAAGDGTQPTGDAHGRPTGYEETVIINALDTSAFSRDYLAKVHRSGVTAFHATVTALHPCRGTVDLIAQWYRKIEENADIVVEATSAQGIHAAKQSGRTAVILGFQNTSPIDDNAELLAVYKRLGIMIIQLTYNFRNLVADGCLEGSDAGLSDFGRDVVKEMNRLRILIDLSHVGERSALEAVELSRRPCAFTHANPRAVCDQRRNKSDECLKALAAKGGVVGVNAFPTFVSVQNPTLETLLDHIDYLVHLIGVEHVGLGLDFTEDQPMEFFMSRSGLGGRFPEGMLPSQWPYVFPRGIASAADLPNVWNGLLRRGYSIAETRRIMGENFLRLFEEVWGE